MSTHWKTIINLIKDSEIHVWYSEEEEWAYVSGKGQRQKITASMSLDAVILIIKNLEPVRFNQD